MRVMDVVNQTKAAMRASEVFGTPYEKNGVTIIPAARIAGGAGGGGDQQEPQAGGVGFGVSARPVGAFVIKGGEVSWQPSLDLNRVILMGQVVGIVALLTVRAAIKAWAKRRTGSRRRSTSTCSRAGDEIVVPRLEHDGNVSPWLALQEQGVVIRFADIRTPECTLDLDDLRRQLTERTRLVAVTHASNVVGTIPDLQAVASAAHAVGAWLWVDAVHYAPHGPIDVQPIGCDFLTCSGYKFYGPHLGILYGRRELLERLRPYQVRPASDDGPGPWETGTQNHECLAGLLGAFEYLADLGRSKVVRREALVSGMQP